MNRMERKAMADSRALEEQNERMNPLSGRGATPSMGLSQFRGGKKMMKNAAAQGKQLMDHLTSLHGGAYAKEFHKGMSGAGPFSSLGHGISDIVGLFGLGKKEESESESDEEEEMKKKKKKGGLRTGRYEGQGKITAAEKKALQSVLDKHKMDGGSRCVGGRAAPPTPHGPPRHELMEGAGPFSNLGHGISDIVGMFGLGKKKKEKRVVGAGDGRRKRADVVRKVMAEKGMKMIEASKYVKEHGLYKP